MGAGFLGLNLAQKLVDERFKVRSSLDVPPLAEGGKWVRCGIAAKCDLKSRMEFLPELVKIMAHRISTAGRRSLD